MIALRVALLVFCVSARCSGQAHLVFTVTNEVKNETLDCTFSKSITILNWDDADPVLQYNTGFSIGGINQNEFAYTTESFEGKIPHKEYLAMVNRAKKIPIKKQKDSDDAVVTSRITIDGEEDRVFAPSATKLIKEWEAFIDSFLTKYAPTAEREKSIWRFQGEVIEPQAVSFAELFENPKKFDGKRIRLTGFFHSGFECSSFAPKATGIRNYKKALWLGASSSFANPAMVIRPNDSRLTIDGTFEIGPSGSGHMGLWKGELSRVTAIREQNKTQHHKSDRAGELED